MVVSSLAALEKLVAAGGVDRALAVLRDGVAPLGDPAVADILARSAATLDRYPDQLVSHLRGRLDEQAPGSAALARLLDEVPLRAPDLRLLSASLEPARSPHLGTVVPHGALIHALVVLDDGATVVCASEDGGALSVLSLSPLLAVDQLTGHDGPVNHLAKAGPDGLVVSGGDDHTVRVWDVPGRRAVHVLRGHTHYVRQVAAAAGRIVSGSQDGTVRVWDLTTGACLHVLDDHRADVMAVAISADGRTAASSSMDNAVYVWDLDRGELKYPLYDSQSELMKFEFDGEAYLTVPGPGANPDLHRECPTQLELSPDGRRLASAQDEVIWWDLPTGAVLARTERQRAVIRGFASRPDGRQLAMFGLHGVQLWDTTTPDSPRPVATLERSDTTAACYAPDGTTLLAGIDRGHVSAWRSRIDPAWSGRPLHRGRAGTVRISPDGRWGATGDSIGGFRIWDLGSGRPVASLRHETTSAADPVCAFGADGTTLITAGDGDVVVWDCATGEPLLRPVRPAGVDLQGIHALAPLPDGRSVLVGMLGDGLVRWDLHAGTATTLQGRTKQISDVRIAPDGRHVVTNAYLEPDDEPSDDRETLQCWDLTTGRLLWTRNARLAGPKFAMFAFSAPTADSRRVLSQSDRSHDTLASWNMTDGERLAELPVPGYVIDARWDADSLLVAATDSDTGTAAVHRIAPDLSALHHSAPVPPLHRARLVPGGRYLLARLLNEERDIVLVDLHNGEPCARFTADAAILSLAVSPDATTALATDWDGRVHILRLSAH